MTTARHILDEAAERIEEEKRVLRQEQEAFQNFRESVSRVQTTAADNGIQTVRLREVYKGTAMATPDFKEAYDESLSESLEAELSPSIANALCRDNPISQRLKRDILVRTNAAIESRTQFIRVLEDEYESLQTIRDTVIDIRDLIQRLPDCSFQDLGFETIIEVWEICAEAVRQCDKRSQERQQYMAERPNIEGNTDVGVHAFNEYLYDDMKTEFPALHSLALSRRRIAQYRGESAKPVDRRQRNKCVIGTSSD